MIAHASGRSLYKIAFLCLKVFTGRDPEELLKAVGKMAGVIESVRIGNLRQGRSFQQHFSGLAQPVKHNIGLGGDTFGVLEGPDKMEFAHTELTAKPIGIDGLVGIGFDDLVYTGKAPCPPVLFIRSDGMPGQPLYSTLQTYNVIRIECLKKRLIESLVMDHPLQRIDPSPFEMPEYIRVDINGFITIPRLAQRVAFIFRRKKFCIVKMG